ncbi:hypothetical protein [Streptomyces sp. SID3343]|uniref:hypothetical protein n=1 Tax=Streptomyces sp. SID3343 TaxID=2690260 RepID=UPI001371B862|nr:hypothetical protein [Streptomyces sp. SID3343]MYV96975.1 hypothetical protein [Streptomyces sp. SID3343]MYW06745.1 hypothetical protein [Streptomyces sp. SID3343]
MPDRAFRLTFDLIRCTGCGVRRVRDVLFRTMQAVARNELGSAERLAVAVRTILAERALLAAAPRHRPYIGSVDAADATVDLLARMIRSYLDALRADTPLKAQLRACF